MRRPQWGGGGGGVFFVLALAVGLCIIGGVHAAITTQPTGLVRKYYNITCHNAERFVRHQVTLFYKKDPTITPKFLRLLYSDCFVTGCDASILLDVPKSEKTASQNIGLGGFVLIDKIKKVLESRCPGVVSCADILNLATRDAVHLAGGPSYPVLLGRKDGYKSSAASVDLPSPSISWETSLSYFKSKGLDVLDMTTLLGAHTMGRSHCSYIMDRIYNYKGSRKADPSMDKSLVADLKKQCPSKTRKGQQDPLVYLNPDSKYSFSNSYYSRVLKDLSVLQVDQQLKYGNDTLAITQEYAAGLQDFKLTFTLSMNRMGSIGVLTGKKGEIRRHCRYSNANNPNGK
ncbi:probable peroxidase 26 [Telopea speciosissima]|uniref:probable peroxidase 26 n=1 Tax=Telopea speciosissima TaxID=54955 RepID=UPI001CC78039|nr:probable peroxidase 26 [Telopea speciosissima]